MAIGILIIFGSFNDIAALYSNNHSLKIKFVFQDICICGGNCTCTRVEKLRPKSSNCGILFEGRHWLPFALKTDNYIFVYW